MLHVRIASPPGLTECLLQALTTNGIEDLVVLRSRARPRRAAGGAALQLLLNVGLLILVGAATLRAQRLIWHRPVQA